MATLTRTDLRADRRHDLAREADVRSSHLRAFRLPAVGGVARVALVPEQAVLLAGDAVSVSVRVGAGRSLEIVEPGGTVAYAMRGREARWDVTVEVEVGGSLVWHGEPFVVSDGADVLRTLDVDLGEAASLVLRETLVLGRSGQRPGRLISRTAVRREGEPVILEDLDAAVGLGPHRVLDQVLHLGSGCETDADTLVLESGDRLHRWLGDATHSSPLVVCQPVRQSSASPE